MIDRVKVSVFEACMGETFRFRDGGGEAHEVVLVEAKAVEPRPGLAQQGIRDDPFSLLFRAPAASELGQGLYAVEHPRLGNFDLFVGPIGFRKPTDPIVLQAVIC